MREQSRLSLNVESIWALSGGVKRPERQDQPDTPTQYASCTCALPNPEGEPPQPRPTPETPQPPAPLPR